METLIVRNIKNGGAVMDMKQSLKGFKVRPYNEIQKNLDAMTRKTLRAAKPIQPPKGQQKGDRTAAL